MSQLAQQAIALHQQGRLADAETLYRQWLAQVPEDFAPHYYLGVICMQQGRLTEALPLLDTALRLNPGEVSLLINHGMTLRLLGCAGEAVASLDRAVSLQPGLAEAHVQRGLALDRQEHAWRPGMTMELSPTNQAPPLRVKARKRNY